MRLRSCFVRVAAILVLLVGGVYPRTAGAGETAPVAPSVLGGIERYALVNGLRVVLNPIPGRASVGVSVTYGVGSRDEKEGQTGVAHLMEHLMFQGSLNVEPGEHARLITARGGNSRGKASQDTTTYSAEIPSGELELLLWLEAERMFRLALTRQTFTSQRNIVAEELRSRHTDPTTRGHWRLNELVFQRYWPYEHPPLGYLRDLEQLQYAAVKQFHQEYYGPARAVLTVVGGFDVDQTKAWIDQYFTAPGVAPTTPPLTTERRAPTLPRQTSERLSVLEAPTSRTPGVHYGWRIPGARTPDNRALELAAFILTGNETSRLSEHLVSKEQLAVSVQASTAGFVDADLFSIEVEVTRRSTVDAMQKALEKALATFAVTGPSEHELERAKTALRVRWLQRVERSKSRAMDLGRLEAVWGDATLLNEDFAAYELVTPAAVRAAVARHLVDTRRSIVEAYPPGWVRDVGPPIITATYVVKPGDNLTRIAQWHGTTAEAIAKQNGLALGRRIVVGQRLLITANPSKIVKPITHTVAKGETLIGIGKKYGVDATDIAKRNGLNAKKAIRPGQVLHIPPKPKSDASKPDGKAPGAAESKSAPAPGTSKTAAPKSPASAAPAPKSPTSAAPAPKSPASAPAPSAAPKSPANAPAPSAAPTRTYVVKPGDSLSVIAARHKVSVAALVRANGISQKKPIRPGQKLVIPPPQ